jgi:hypothetical protein
MIYHPSWTLPRVNTGAGASSAVSLPADLGRNVERKMWLWGEEIFELYNL